MSMLRSTRVSKLVALLALVAGVLTAAPGSAGALPLTPEDLGGVYYGVSPVRVLDTRTTNGGPCLQPGETRFVNVTGYSGVPVDASSVVLNVTAVGATADGFVSVFPAGEDRPGTSSLNYRASRVVANSATVKVGVNGQVAVFANIGCPNLLIDVMGFYTDGTFAPGAFRAISPIRRLDTRTGATRPCQNGLTRSAQRNVVVTGAGGVPADATSVTVNVTVVAPSALGFLTLFPAGSLKPGASTINFAAGEVRANQATVQVGTGGALTIFNFDGCVDVLVDVVGYTSAGLGPSGTFLPQSPSRLLDTRDPGKGGCIAPGTVRNLVVDPIFAIRTPPRLYSVTVNITVTGAVGDGFVTLFPKLAEQPGTSNVNFSAGQTVANGATVQLGALGSVSIYSNNGCPNVIIDVAGLSKLPPAVSVVSTTAGYGSLRDGVRGVALLPEARLADPTGLVADPAGNIFFTEPRAHVVRKLTPSGRVTTVAGRLGHAGQSDGAGPAARLLAPTGIARDASGNLYVAEPDNNGVRRITPTGTVSTVAGLLHVPGLTNGTVGGAAEPKFSGPRGVAVDALGNVFVADTGNHQIRKLTPSGVVTLFAGAADGSAGNVDGTGSAARFASPVGLAFDAAGNLFVADTLNGKIRKVTPAGVVTTVIGCPPTDAGDLGLIPTGGCYFVQPTGVAVMANGHLAVTDPGRAQVAEVTIGSPSSATTRAGSFKTGGLLNGAGGVALFEQPAGVAALADGTIVVADEQAVRKVGLATATTPNLVSSLAGDISTSGTGGVANALRLDGPVDVVAVSSGELLVVESGSHTVRRVRGGLLNDRFAGTTDLSAVLDGPALSAAFTSFGGIVRDSSGTVYVSETSSCVIRKISSGTVSTLAGSSGQCSFANGTGSAARFSRPTGLALDSVGNVFVADTNNNRIRKVTPAGVVTTVAGGAAAGSADNVAALSATFDHPEGVAVDGSGNLYVSDSVNGTIRKVAAAGGVTTLAGDAAVFPSFQNGTGASASFQNPGDLALDGSGNLYVSDGGSAVRKVRTSTGEVTTIAGSEFSAVAVDGTGPNSKFVDIVGLTLDPDGNLLVVESGGGFGIHSIRKITLLP